jgi:hypothetical protein
LFTLSRTLGSKYVGRRKNIWVPNSSGPTEIKDRTKILTYKVYFVGFWEKVEENGNISVDSCLQISDLSNGHQI